MNVRLIVLTTCPLCLRPLLEFSDSSSVASEEKMLDRLPVLFNDILLPSWYSQLKWCGIVFGSAESSQIAIQGKDCKARDFVLSEAFDVDRFTFSAG